MYSQGSMLLCLQTCSGANLTVPFEGLARDFPFITRDCFHIHEYWFHN